MTRFVSDPNVAISETHHGGWQASVAWKSDGTIVGFQQHGETIPEALRALAEVVEDANVDTELSALHGGDER